MTKELTDEQSEDLAEAMMDCKHDYFHEEMQVVDYFSPAEYNGHGQYTNHILVCDFCHEVVEWGL